MSALPSGKRTPKMLSSNARSTKRARAPPNTTIDGSAGKSNPDLSIQSAPLYASRGTLLNPRNGDSGPMTSSLYHSGKDHHSFPYPLPTSRYPRPPSDPTNYTRHASNSNNVPNTAIPTTTKPSPPRLPSMASQFPPTPHTPPLPPGKRPTRLAARWIEGKPILPIRRRARSDGDGTEDPLESEDSDTPVTINMGDRVTMTKLEWLQKGHELLERAWHDMVSWEKAKGPPTQQSLPPPPTSAHHQGPQQQATMQGR
jgi:hypothetical protein